MKQKGYIILALVIILVLGIQLYYCFTYLSVDKQIITGNETQISTLENRVVQLEQRLERLPETKKQIEVLQLEKNALLSSLPAVSSSANQLVTIKRFIEGNNFYDASFSLGQVVEIIEGDETILQKDFNLKFTSTLAQTRALVESLNTSNQIINITAMKIDNNVQSSSGDTLKMMRKEVGNQIDDAITTELSLVLFERKVNIIEEGYSQDLNIDFNAHAFKKKDVNLMTNVEDVVEEKEEEIVIPSLEALAPESEIDLETTSVFTVNVKDILTSGDTYKLVGPKDTGYTGLISTTDVSMTITIRDDGYDFAIEDAEGNIEQNSVSVDIQEPIIKLYSTMAQIQENMPHVKLYVYNFSSERATVEINGSMLGEISIYNEFDELVTRGQTKGNVSVK